MGIMEDKFFEKSKLDRIYYLRRLGLNIPIFFEKVSSIKELALFGKNRLGTRVSIRTQGSVLSPHFPNVLIDKKLLKQFSTLIRKKLELLVFEPIDPKNTVIGGNLWINKLEKKVITEYFEGPGTVRDLESKESQSINKVETSVEDFLSKGEGGKTFLGISPEVFLNFPFNNFILEFSQLKFPVGEKKSEYVFWEVRRG